MASHTPSSEGIPDPSSRADSPTVILACAAADLEIVSETARALRERGHEVEVVSGVQTEPDRLFDVVRRLDRQGLYVLCRSAALDRTVVDRLRLVLRNAEVPFGRTLTLAVESGANAARALEDRIVSVTKRMVTGKGDSGPVRSSAILPPPPQTKVTRIPQPPDQPASDELGARVQEAQARFPIGGTPVSEHDPIDESDVDAWADSLAGRPIVDPMGSGELDPVDRTSVDQSFDGYPLDGFGTPETTEDAPSEAILAAGDATQVGAAPEEDDEMTQPVRRVQRDFVDDDDELDLMDRTMVSPPEEAARPFVPPVPGAPVGAGASPVSAPAVAGSSAAGFGDEDEDVEHGGGNKLMWLVGGGGGALLLIVVLGVALSSDDDAAAKESDEGDVVAKADEPDGSQAQEPEADEAEEPEPADAPEAEAVAEKPDPEQPEPKDPEPEAAVPETDEATGDANDANDEVAEPLGGDEGIEPPLGPGPVAAEDSQLVLAALASRDVRALDTFLVAEETSKDTTFERAMSYCDKLEVGGLTGWRVPTIGELWSLGAAKVVKRGLYWSVTLGDAYGEKRLIYNARKDSIAPVDATWDGAQAVCIRERT